MEPERSSSCSQQPANFPYPETLPLHAPSPLHAIFWRSILILYFLLRLGLRSGFFPSGFPTKILYASLLSPKAVTCTVHSFSWFYHPNSIWWEVQITKAPRYVVSSTHFVTSPRLGPNVFLTTLFSNTFGLCSSLNPSAWSDGHCPHAACSHSFVYISTS